MSIESNNLAILQKNYPEIWAKIKDIKPNTKYVLTAVPGKNNIPNLKETATGKLFYDNTDPLNNAVRYVASKKIKLPFFNVFLGAGLMYHFFAFFQAYQVKDSVNIIVENDLDIFRTMISCVDISKPLENKMFYFLVAEQPTVLFTKINRIIHSTNAKFYAKSINFIEDPACFTINKEYYLNTIKILKEALREVMMFYGNDPFDSMIGIENIFLNIDEIIQNPGIKDLKDKFKGKPGIVVSTGPSLNKNIELLHGLENKAVICAADASVRVMKSHGLKPHLVSSLERMTPTAKLFEELTEEDLKDVYLAACPVIHPQTYANYHGERIITYRDFATFKWINIEKGILEIGPSAGNMAFKMLEHMGCDPIILIGQDLAFGPDDLTHAEGSTYGEKQNTKAMQEQREVEGNYQPKVKTTRVWELFLQFYHKDASSSKAKVINATEGGAKILGTEIMTFKEAIDGFIKDDINVMDTIKASLNKPTEAEIAEYRDRTLQIVDNAIVFCESAQSVFAEAIALCDEYLKEIFIPYKATGKYDEKRGEEYLLKLEDKSAIFRQREFYEVLMHYVQSYFIKTMIEINASKSTAESQAEAQSKNVMILKDMFNVMTGLNGKMIQLMYILKKRLEDAKTTDG